MAPDRLLLPDRILFIPSPCHREYTRLVGSILSSYLHPFSQEADPGAAPADTSSLPDISLSSSFQIRLPALIHVKCRYHIFCFFYYDSLLLSLPDRYFMAKLLLSHHGLCFGICTCVYWLFTFQCTIPAVLSAHENTFWGIVKCAFID